MDYINRLTLNIHQGKSALECLQTDWRNLLLKISTPSLEQDWRWNFILADQVFGSRYTVISIYDNKELIAAFPLEEKKITRLGIPFRCLSNLTDDKLLDLSDALIHPDWKDKPILQVIKRHLASTKFDLIEFSEFTSRSNVAELPNDGWRFELANHQNAYTLCSSPDDLKSLSKKHIKNIERLSAKAEAELGNIQLEILLGNQIKKSDIDDLVDIENSGWKAASGTSIYASNTQNFYESAIQALSVTNDAYIIFLKAADKRISCALAFKAKNRLFLHKIAYRDETKEFGPGNIMLLNLLRAMAQQPDIDEVNLVTCPDWCERWHFQVANRMSLRCFNTKLKGRIYSFLLNAKTYLKQRSKINTKAFEKHDE